jgi:hypothetical protein
MAFRPGFPILKSLRPFRFVRSFRIGLARAGLSKKYSFFNGRKAAAATTEPSIGRWPGLLEKMGFRKGWRKRFSLHFVG